MKSLFSKLFPPKQKIQITFCQKNLDLHLDQELTIAFSEFLQNNQIQYKEYECLNHCATCRTSAYATVNGQYIEAENMTHLLLRLQAKVNSPN